VPLRCLTGISLHEQRRWPLRHGNSPVLHAPANAVQARYRGGFMSVNSAVQQAASGLASLLAGAFITTRADGHLLGYGNLGFVSVGFFILTVYFAARLRHAAPHVAHAGLIAPAGPKNS
jgi:hypothetical protein